MGVWTVHTSCVPTMTRSRPLSIIRSVEVEVPLSRSVQVSLNCQLSPLWTPVGRVRASGGSVQSLWSYGSPLSTKRACPAD